MDELSEEVRIILQSHPEELGASTYVEKYMIGQRLVLVMVLFLIGRIK